MKLHDVVGLGITSIWHNKLRAGLSILGLLIGNASVISMISIGEGAEQIMTDDIEKLGGANQFILLRAGRIYRKGRLVVCQPSVEGYSLLSLMRASSVVNRHLTVARC